jgi:hypothetical protein
MSKAEGTSWRLRGVCFAIFAAKISGSFNCSISSAFQFEFVILDGVTILKTGLESIRGLTFLLPCSICWFR